MITGSLADFFGWLLPAHSPVPTSGKKVARKQSEGIPGACLSGSGYLSPQDPGSTDFQEPSVVILANPQGLNQRPHSEGAGIRAADKREEPL